MNDNAPDDMPDGESDGHDIEISLLRLRDAHALAPLIAAYGQALKRGAPRRPDQYYAEQLLQDRVAEFLGARIDGELVGFILFYDLPEPVSGKRAGQADHIYVHHARRGKGIAKALVDVLARSRPLREELLHRLGRSPAVAQLAMRFVSALVGDAVQENRQRVERVPGAKSLLGMGDFAARQARGMAPKQLERMVGGAADRGTQAAMERVTRALLDTFDADAVRTAAIEVWDLHARESVAGLRAYLTQDEAEQVAASGHDVWRGLQTPAWFRAALDAAVDAFLQRYGDEPVGAVLDELGTDDGLVSAAIQRHAPRILEVLHREGHLESLVRRRLEPFYRSEVALDILGGART